MGSILPVAPNSFEEKDLLPLTESLKLVARLDTVVMVDPRPSSIAIDPFTVVLAWDFHCTLSAVILYSAQAFRVPPPSDGV